VSFRVLNNQQHIALLNIVPSPGLRDLTPEVLIQYFSFSYSCSSYMPEIDLTNLRKTFFGLTYSFQHQKTLVIMACQNPEFLPIHITPHASLNIQIPTPISLFEMMASLVLGIIGGGFILGKPTRASKVNNMPTEKREERTMTSIQVDISRISQNPDLIPSDYKFLPFPLPLFPKLYTNIPQPTNHRYPALSLNLLTKQNKTKQNTKNVPLP
jgi:hypothetical protein